MFGQFCPDAQILVYEFSEKVSLEKSFEFYQLIIQHYEVVDTLCQITSKTEHYSCFFLPVTYLNESIFFLNVL